MANKDDTEWDSIVEITYEVTRNQLARGYYFQQILANTLEVGGEYQVRLSTNVNLS